MYKIKVQPCMKFLLTHMQMESQGSIGAPKLYEAF